MTKCLMTVLTLLLVSCAPAPSVGRTTIVETEPNETRLANVLDCYSHHTTFLPGQSLSDPQDQQLPGHVDILNIQTSLKNQTLTTEVHFRQLPETIELNREGSDQMSIEYTWSLEIDIDGDTVDGFTHERNRYEYNVMIHSDAVRSQSPPSTHVPFKSVLSVDILKSQQDEEYGFVWKSIPAHNASVWTSHRNNTITFTSHIPNITNDSPMKFSAFDALKGMDCITPPNSTSP